MSQHSPLLIARLFQHIIYLSLAWSINCFNHLNPWVVLIILIHGEQEGSIIPKFDICQDSNKLVGNIYIRPKVLG